MRSFSSKEGSSFSILDINKTIDSVLLMQLNSYKNKIVITKKYTQQSDIIGDQVKLHQLFMNLISNAIQSIEDKGEIIIETKRSKTEELIIKIKDNGGGITNNIKNKIFDPFFTTKEVGKGIGLGLYLTYNYIEQHKGTIECKSKEGTGTEFIITFPNKTN